MFKDRRRVAIIAGLGILFVCLVCGVIYVFFPPGEGEGEPTSVAGAPTEGATEVLPTEEAPLPSDTPPPTNTPEPTITPRPTAIVFKTSTPSVADGLYDDLIFILDEQTILNVKISGRDLVIQTNLDRSNMEWFFTDIASIHGVVAEREPDIDRMILNDIFGQQIIIPMDAMMSFYNHSIDWETFRSTWTIINP